MSARAVAWAQVQAAPDALAKLVLLTLADHADATDTCWPTLDRIEAETQLRARAVAEALAQLEERGLISIRKGLRANTYRLQRHRAAA